MNTDLRFLPQLGLAILALIACGGCPGTTPPEPAAKGRPADEPAAPLRVAVVDDLGLAEAVARQWRARAEGEVEIRPMTLTELLAPGRQRLAADVILYPSGFLGELAERDWIAPIESEVFNGPEFGRRDIFDHLRQHEIVWGKRVFAVPLGSPALTIVYRPDVFTQAGVAPPQTWQQYAEVCDKLSKTATPTVIEPLGPGWAGQVLLARAAAYVRHPSYFATLFQADTMEPNIASPPFVRALEELVAAAKHGPPDALKYSPADVRRELRQGRGVLGLTWPSRADDRAADAASSAPPTIQLTAAELPASSRVFHLTAKEWQNRESSEPGCATLLAVAGRLGSVVKGSRRPQAALAMLLRLSSSEWSADISPLSRDTTLYRASQTARAGDWVGDDFDAEATKAYAELVRTIYRRSLWLTSPRLPGRQRYLAALDEAVQRAVRGEQTPAASLEQAAAAWHAITQELGVEKQRAAYWRSLGVEP